MIEIKNSKSYLAKLKNVMPNYVISSIPNVLKHM